MFSLSQNWITENHIDFEYKKYMVLAYLQDVKQHLTEAKLFPAISDLKKHHQSLSAIKSQKETITNDFKKELNYLDWSTQSLHYKSLFVEGEVMKTLQEIIDFSLPLFQNQLQEGKKIAQFVEEHLTICPVGIVPIRLSEGYLLINCSGSKKVEVYHYQISIFDEADAQFPSVNLQWTDTYETAIDNTFEKIKQDLISTRKELPNPATYSITSDMQFPMTETLLPIAKMSLSKHLTQTIH